MHLYSRISKLKMHVEKEKEGESRGKEGGREESKV